MAENGRGGDLRSAATSLRESAKWLVGGVALTAAGVFAGSSLTNLGSLDPATNGGRLAIAIAGAVIGFIALALIMTRAIAVLTIESFTFRMLARAEQSDAKADAALRGVAAEVVRKYRSSFPLPVETLSALAQGIDALDEGDPRLADAERFDAIVMPDAVFLSVRARFVRLSHTLIWAAAMAAFGFGLFAWAANPPAGTSERTQAPPPDSISIATGASGAPRDRRAPRGS